MRLSEEMTTVPQRLTSTRPGRDLAAGATYVALSVILFGAWLVIDRVLVLMLALPTAVGGVVELSVGWSRLRRRRAEARLGVVRR